MITALLPARPDSWYSLWTPQPPQIIYLDWRIIVVRFDRAKDCAAAIALALSDGRDDWQPEILRPKPCGCSKRPNRVECWKEGFYGMVRAFLWNS